MIKRLFDIVSAQAKENPNAVMLAAKEQDMWRTYSSADVWETARKLAGGLESLGIANADLDPEKQEKIAIISPNRPEWIITDVAVQLTGGVLTPVYPTLAPNDLAYILKEAEIKILFLSNKDIYERFKDALSQVPTLKHIFTFDKVDGLTHWQELIAKNVLPDERVIERIKPETLTTIIYTSGTTGNPKGVMLSHNNIASNVRDCMCEFWFASKGERALSFLPLNHIFEKMVTYVYLNAGVSVYYAESMDTIGENLKEVKPVVFTTVPRLLEKVYEKIFGKGLELTGIKRKLFFWALGLGFKYDNINQGSLWYRMQLSLANKLIFSKWREALGGNVRAIVTGAAACQERLIRIFSSAGITIMEGYGLTETSPVISVNKYKSEDRRIGSIGPVIQNVEVKLGEDGEIMVRGQNIMMGYYKNPSLTAEVVDKDGWFKTGDIGTWVEDRFLKITDRKKEIFKTAGGKYVAPQVIENKMKESLFIEQMIVIGSGRKFVSALIVPALTHIRKHLEDKGMKTPATNDELVRLPEVVDLVQKQVDKYNPLFGHVEQVKKFALLPNEWTIDSGELTPSIKIKRKVIEQKYSGEIEKMYN
ncbi:AMP-dependent synthetase/ligase [Polluticoccus soli]|uniref:AMP-dependent synthetase/ligase n=1 Tax=Polluticoccus soli TaxID=3034150 RepID=UPI0023E1A5E4|nr:long-chain fatty acid--CoA ligase [Flavipsychrobacter sp. JY13-12]